MINGNAASKILAVEKLTAEGRDHTLSDTAEYLERIKQVNRLPFNRVTVYYSDDYWNFEGYTNANIDTSYLHFYFQKCPTGFRDDLKNYVLLSIIQDRCKIQIIRDRFNLIRRFFCYISQNGVANIKNIQPQMSRDWISSLDISITTSFIYVQALNSFFETYNIYIDEIFGDEFFVRFTAIEEQEMKHERINRKTPSIPDEFFNQSLAAAIKTMNDIAAPTFYRGMAAMLVIASQTGLRTGELFALEIGNVHPVGTIDGVTIYNLTYKTWKNAHGSQTMNTATTHFNQLAKNAYDVLTELYEEKRNNWNLNYLFLDSKNKHGPSKFPVAPISAAENFTYLFYYFNRFFKTVLEEPSTDPMLRTVKYQPSKRSPAVYILKPSVMQYRVYLCSQLYAKGVPMEYVNKCMAHLYKEMEYYYARSKSTMQEDAELATKVIYELVTKKVTPLGADKGLVEKIDEFIARNNYNVETDIDTICEKLAALIPIRQKTGGYCIKSSKFRECSKDAATNEYYCAYGVCPNIYTFYYHVCVSYRQAKDLVDSITRNKVAGHIRQAEKESNMLRTILKKKLEPQLKDLKDRIDKYGVAQILSEHPEVADIVEDMNRVEREVNTWRTI